MRKLYLPNHPPKTEGLLTSETRSPEALGSRLESWVILTVSGGVSKSENGGCFPFTHLGHVLKTRVDEGEKGTIPTINSCGSPA